MQIVVKQNRNEMGLYTATEAAKFLRDRLAQKPECNIVVATGSSQFEVLECLVAQSGIDWSRINGFHLDEYLGIDRNHPASFCGYLAQRFVDRVPLKSFYFLDGTKPADELRKAASQKNIWLQD